MAAANRSITSDPTKLERANVGMLVIWDGGSFEGAVLRRPYISMIRSGVVVCNELALFDMVLVLHGHILR